MNPQIRLTPEELEALARIRERFTQEGLRMTDEKFVLIMLRAAAQLPEEELVRLLKQEMQGVRPEDDPPGDTAGS